MITLAEVRDKGWVVIGDDVYDITRFAEKHRGGREILNLRGGDATFPLINAHGVGGELPRLPPKLRVGKIDVATLPPVDRDLRALWASLRERGMFRYKRRWFVLDLVRGLGLFALGWLSMRSMPALAFVSLLVALLNVMWWVHDACHDSVFTDRATARRWAEIASIAFVGTSVHDYQYRVHRLHHGFTNTIGADQAIETGPVVWHELMRARTSDTFLPIQSWFWFLVVLPLTLPYFLWIGLERAARRRAYGTIVAVIARWIVALWLFRAHLAVFLLPNVLAAYLLGLTASLNHFHRPMSAISDWNFVRSVTCVTQNLGATDRFSAWLCGGLSFHIEHHLFATMPRRNYRLIAADVRALCERHGLPYTTVSIPEAIGRLWSKLRHPYRDNAPPIRPSMDASHVPWR